MTRHEVENEAPLGGKDQARAKMTNRTIERATTGPDERAEKEQSIIRGVKVSKPCRTIRASKDNDVLTTDGEPLGLEMTLPRRVDWTPPQIRHTNMIDLTDESPADSDHVEAQTALSNMLGSFGYGPGTVAAAKATRQEVQGKPTLKRRKLDMVSGGALPMSVPTPKEKKRREKAPKKKPQTITELATRDYVAIDVEKQPSSFMEEFLSQTPAKPVTSADGAKKDMGDPQHAEKSNHNPSRKQKTAATKHPVSEVLSPEAAIQAAGCQDLLFGTSSQLVREESPSFIRDLQHALRESEASAGQEEAARQGGDAKPSKTLWNAATRDLDGSLLEAETIDLTKTPKVMWTRHDSSSGPLHQTPVLMAPARKVALPEIDAAAKDVVRVRGSKGSARLSEDYQGQPLLTNLPKSMAEAACRVRPRSKSPVKKATSPKKRELKAKAKTTARKEANPGAGLQVDGIDYNKWTVAELSKKIKSFGFKAVKGKANMVALLEKCSASTGGGAQTIRADSHVDDRSSPGKAASDVASLPRKRGRPKKVEASATEGTEVQWGRQILPVGEVSQQLTLGTATLTSSERTASELQEVISAGIRDATTSGTAPDPARATSLARHSRQADTPVSPRGKADRAQNRGRCSSNVASVPDNRSDPCEIAGDGVDGRCCVDKVVQVATDAGTGANLVDPDARLLNAITAAVTTFPPTHDPGQPTWHEKMLMYDPIVLEDLTIWLNTAGLNRVGVDEEVWPSLVRQWCEQRSVCCLWRENLRGGTRSRY